ncbi:MAG: hypothetical protein IJW54_01255 [Clostridia bacterium]|nr:hypothetical protein [Clostridia bacterium]
MKKALILLPLILLSLSSCINQSYGILPYQQKNIEAEITVNNEFKIRLIKRENITLEIIEPKELDTMSFIIEENGILAKNNNIEILLEKESLDGIYALSQIFSLNESFLTSMEEGQLTFEQNETHYKLTLGKNDLPDKIIISSNSFYYEISIDGIEILS